jgi:hypothetical protein
MKWESKINILYSMHDTPNLINIQTVDSMFNIGSTMDQIWINPEYILDQQ